MRINNVSSQSFGMAVITKPSALKTLQKTATENNYTEVIKQLGDFTQEQKDNHLANVIVKKAHIFSNRVKFIIQNAHNNDTLRVFKQKSPKDVNVLQAVKMATSTATEVVQSSSKIMTSLAKTAPKK